MNKAVIKIENLHVAFKETRILEDVNLEIQTGKIYSIIGPNGCGKTTLLRAMSRNLKPDKGRVLLDKQNIFKTRTKLIAQKMAVLGQSNTSMSDVTVKTLVHYGRFAHKKWWEGQSGDKNIVEWALDKTGMTELQYRKINTLSGGERQRAWIAMAVAQKPKVMLLDEPTTYLDISHQLEIMELVSRLNREERITIVMVLHDMNHAARYSDELIVLKDRNIYKQGDPWEVIKDGVLQDVFRVEADIMTDSDTNKPVFYAKKVVKA